MLSILFIYVTIIPDFTGVVKSLVICAIIYSTSDKELPVRYLYVKASEYLNYKAKEG